MEYGDLFISKKVPKPLNKDQFNYYFEKYHNGDSEARNILIEHNIGLVLSRLYKRFSQLPLDEQRELICVGIEALIKALSRFDLSHNIQFSSYAVAYIDGGMLEYIEKGKRYCNDFSLENLSYINKNDNEIKFEDFLRDKNHDIEANYEKSLSSSIIRELIDTLPSPDREIIILFYGFDENKVHKQKELAKMYNVAPITISKIIKKNTDTLKRKLYEKGIIETTRKCKSKYRDNASVRISGIQTMRMHFRIINNHFINYSNVQILQALQIYISDLSEICSKILVLAFNTDEKITQNQMSITLNCSQWIIYDGIKKINSKLNSKSLFGELTFILSQITSEVKINKINDKQKNLGVKKVIE